MNSRMSSNLLYYEIITSSTKAPKVDEVAYESENSKSEAHWHFPYKLPSFFQLRQNQEVYLNLFISYL